MGADQRVVEVGVEQLGPRDTELGADQHRQEAADTEEHEGHDEVLDADNLVVGRVLPVLRTTGVLARHVLGVGVGEVVTQHPADRAGEGAYADHETDDPADVHERDLDLKAVWQREVVLLPTPGDLLHDRANGDIEDRCENNAAHGGREEVRVAEETPRLTDLTRLGNVRLLVDGYGGGTHDVLAPPCSRTHDVNWSWVTTRSCVSM